jgi:hypothetical protein
MDINIKRLGDDLHAKRRGEYTLESLSAKIGVSHPVLGDIENGVQKKYAGILLVRVARFIGKKLDDYVE